MIIPSQQALFAIPEGTTYLNCANMSPLMRKVEEAGIQSIMQRRQPWTIGADQWFEPGERLRDLFAGLIGAGKDQVALVPSVSYGIAIARNNIKLEAGESIIVLDQEYPSNLYAWRELSKETGAVLVTVKRPTDTSERSGRPERQTGASKRLEGAEISGPPERTSGASWTEAVLAAIDDNTGLVAISNCHWTDGSLIDLEQVSQKVRSVGARLVVDASQSLGAYPLDVRRIKPDFLVTVGYKWLMGPYNLAYLYADEKYFPDGRPIEHSWMVRSGSDDFTRLVEYTDLYKTGARRFDAGEFSSFIHVAMATAALEQINAWGVDNIQDSLSVITNHIGVLAEEMGLEAPVTGDRVGHMIGIRMGGEKLDVVRKVLTENNIYLSFRGSSMRVAPHLYNDEQDVQRLFDVLAAAL